MTIPDVPGHVWQAAVDAAVERIIGAPVADHDPAELDRRGRLPGAR